MTGPRSLRGRLTAALEGRTGAVLWEGPSRIDGAPLVAVATAIVPKGALANEKTGDAAQVYIMRRDVGPLDALHSGADESICGRCVHRPKMGGVRTCYPDVRMINRVWLTYKGDGYPYVTSEAMLRELFGARPVRGGAYGDPAAVDREVWEALDEISPMFWTYTHQWKTAEGQDLLRLGVMASVESEADRLEAKALGFRTFRVRARALSALAEGERFCPADAELAKVRRWKTRSKCIRCGWCSGRSRMKADVSVTAHGQAKVRLRTVLESRLRIVT